MALCKFVMEYATPRRPHGTDVEVVYNPGCQEVVSAEYVGDYRQLPTGEKKILDWVLSDQVKAAGGWHNFSRRKVRLIPE